MKWFGKRREASRPVLARAYGTAGGLGEWPQSYEAQVREGYAANPVAQRAVKIVAEGMAEAPLEASDPALVALATARGQGQELVAILAAQLLLHGNAFVQVGRAGWRSCSRCGRSGSRWKPMPAGGLPPIAIAWAGA